MATEVWSIAARPPLAADTLYRTDLADEATRPPGNDGMLFGNHSAGGINVPPWAGGTVVDQVAGKWTDGLRSHVVSNGIAKVPMHGLLPSDEFTWEWWMLWDVDWSTLSNRLPLGFYFGKDGLEYIRPKISGGNLTFEVVHQHSATADVNKTVSASVTSLLAGVWRHVGVTLKNGVWKLYLDLVEKASMTGVVLPPLIGDDNRDSGLYLCGQGATGNTELTISDMRICRTARVPGVAVTLRDTNTITVAATRRGDTVERNFGGGLHGTNIPHTNGSNEQANAATRLRDTGAVKVLRTDHMVNATPTKAGGVDGTHPYLGHSGAYSYDMQVVARTAQYCVDHGMELYISWDSNPQLLGGATAPLSGTNLTTKRSVDAPFNNSVPNDFAAFATICADIAYYLKNDFPNAAQLKFDYSDLWNEPDGTFFAGGTQAQFLDMYAVWAPAMRAAVPSVKLGGPGTASFNPAWIQAFIQRCAADNLPADFVCYHFYTSNTMVPDRARKLVERWRAQYGLAQQLELVNSEYNTCSIPSFAGNGVIPWNALHYSDNDFAAAVEAVNLIEFQRNGYKRAIWCAIVTDPAGSGYDSAGLVSQTGWWAAGNVHRLWQDMADHVLDSAVDAPGLACVASEDDDGRITVFISSFNFRQYADRTVTVDLSALLDEGTVEHAYLIDKTHSNLRDVGSGGDLQEVTAPTIASGKTSVTLKPRAVTKLDIIPGDAPPPPPLSPIPQLVELDGQPVLLPVA